MMAGKVVALGLEIISKLDSYFLMTISYLKLLFSNPSNAHFRGALLGVKTIRQLCI